MNPKHSHINYLYFGGLFALLVFITAGSVFTKESFGGSQIFFFLYALGQVVLEVALFIFFGILIRKYLGKICFALFIGATFIAMFVHLFDFMMDRILDLTAWEGFKIFVLAENLANFLVLLEASGIPIWAWITFFIVLASLPFLGFFLYQITDVIAKKKPFALRQSHFLQAFICIPCALFLWDFSASKMIHPDAYTAFIKSLPWKLTFLKPENVSFTMPGHLHEPTSEHIQTAAIAENRSTPIKKPNIYLFVIESLREDCITKEIAPYLHQFKNDNTHFDVALSNGNGTHISWFSIFHSEFPYCFNHVKKGSTIGSPALNLLKKWGYQIRLYSSADLIYYGMEDLIFGKNHSLVDHYQSFHKPPPYLAADSDAAALAKLQKDIEENPSLEQGQIFIIFWDCTHFAYSWPKNWAPKFTPFAQELAYFSAFQSKKMIANIKNRYQNSVHYMDHLFGSFVKNLPNWQESVVIVTGDHGEEFFDHGHLFHNSHLTHEQMNVPLYFKFGRQSRPIVSRSVISQMDIFPSIIDYIGEIETTFLEGNSLFRTPKWGYALTSRFNAGLTPYEFSIHNGKTKLIGQFLNRENIFASDEIQVLSLRTSDDKSINGLSNINGYVHEEFGPALNRLFGTP